MTEALTLHELTDRAKVLERYVEENPASVEGDLDALKARIEAGYEKIQAYADAHPRNAVASVIGTARTKLEELEVDLAKAERAIAIPWYFEQALLMIARDALNWSGVPKGSTVTVDMPGVFKIAVRLDNLPEAPPF